MLCFSGSEKVFVKVTFSVLASPWLWLFICCKTSQKKLFFLKKYIYFRLLQNIYYLQKKNLFIRNKNFMQKKSYYWEKLFFRKKIYFLYRKYMCCANKKIYLIILQKNFFDHKKYICENFLANSIIWSFKFLKHPIFGIS